MAKQYVSIVNRDPYIVLYYRDANGELQQEQRRVSWYFGIAKSDLQKPQLAMKIAQLKVNLDKKQRITKVVELGEYALIYCSKYSSVPEIFRQLKIQTYEDDLSLARRFWLDSELKVATEYKIAFFDIETDDTIGEISIGRDKILSFAVKDMEGNEFFYSLKDFDMSEKKLLEKFMEVINKYDLISGWNSWKFDLPYIKARMFLYGITWWEERRLSHIDLQQRMIHSYRFDSKIRSFSLEYIANRFLGSGKIQHKEKFIDFFNNRYDTFKEYNLRDVQLLYELEKKNKILDVLLKQAIWCNIFPKEISPTGKSLYRLLDNLILGMTHQHHKMGFSPKFTSQMVAKMSEAELEKLEYPGGYVMTPVIGAYPEVYGFDFKSLYPSIIRAFNIGLDTRITKFTIEQLPLLNKNPEGSHYIKEPPSVISIILDFLLDKRKEYKKRILKLVEEGKTGTSEYEAAHADEVVVKELSNSVYGICGRRDGRYFSTEVASSITLAGQWLIKSLSRFAELKGYKMIYGDTDSGMLANMPLDFDYMKFLDEYHAWLKNEIKVEWNVDKMYFSLEFDRYYKKYILVSKKNYAGWVLNQEHKKTDYIYVRGLEVMKSSTCPLAYRAQDEIIKMLLKEDHDVNFWRKWMEDKREHIFDNIVGEDLVLTNKVNKKFTEYKNKSLPVHLAELKLKRDGILMNKEIQYIVTSTKPTLNGVESVDYKGEYDKLYYWDRVVLMCLNRLLSVVYPEVIWKKEYKYENIAAKQLTLF